MKPKFSDHYQKFSVLRVDASTFIGFYLDSKYDLKATKFDNTGEVVQRSGFIVKNSAVNEYKAVRFGSNILVYVERLLHNFDSTLHDVCQCSLFLIDSDDLITLNQVSVA